MKPICPSIITNFGCDRNCWYCITKRQNPERFRQDTDWALLELFLSRGWARNKVSVSGGGDPLYNLEGNMDWWERLFNITDRLGMEVDVHTRIIVDKPDFWRRINRCCLSVDDVDSARRALDLVTPHTRRRTRLVRVATPGTTIKELLDMRTFCASNGFQMSLKELAEFDDGGTFDKMKRIFKGTGVFMIEDRDYNVYYMPDNTITAKFRDPIPEGEQK